MTGAFNAKTRLDARARGRPSRGSSPRACGWCRASLARCNVYLIEDEGGVTHVRCGRAHDDARGRERRREAGRHPPDRARPRPHRPPRHALPALGVPVLLPPRRGAGRRGQRRLSLLAARVSPACRAPAPAPPAAPPLRLGRRTGARSLAPSSEGDEIAGFASCTCPGTRPGMIGLWRESDRLALVGDCFYTLDMWGRDSDRARARADLQLRHRARRARACASWR